MSFGWQRQDASQMAGVVGMASQHMREETVQCRKPAVASSDAVVSFTFQMLQKRKDQSSVKIRQPQPLHWNLFGPGGIIQKQSQRVAVAGQGAAGATTRALQVVDKE